MLFVAEYELGWDQLENAMAKRLEWNDVRPEDFSFVGEYIWQSGEPPFKGVAIIDCESVEAVNQFVLHYGPTLKMIVHPATDVLSGIHAVQDQTALRGAGGGRVSPRKRKARRGR